MNQANWTELGELFNDLTAKPALERALELEKIKQRDPNLFTELSSLLNAHDSADGFFENKIERIFASLTPVQLKAGERLLHFEIVELLGEGSVAKVYLARDLELGRLVALKVTLSQSKEARTLANFNIDGIVQVYSDHWTEHGGQLLRLMCLQFIAGPTLARLEQDLRTRKGTVASLVELLEGYSQRHVVLENAALKWRERLASLSVAEGIVLLGMRLAEILSQAHARGILHLDIKPANILIDPFGRPCLSDFNVSTEQEKLSQGDLEGMGGTPYYMPPEQARLFEAGESASTVDQRSDIYSLGVVLRDLLRSAGFSDGLLEEILSRAAAPDQNCRHPSAAHLAGELGAWLRGRLAAKEMPRLWSGFGWITRYPLFALISLSLLTQLIASLINISYNRLQIMAALTPGQNELFLKCVGFYNLVTYPLTLAIGLYALRSLFQRNADPALARRSALRVPLVVFLMISFGWLPGAWIFPRAIEYFAGPVPDYVYWKFVFSFTLAWLISLSTTLSVSIFVLLRGLYPKYWQGRSDLAAHELRHCEGVNRSLVFVSALVPLSGILLAVLVEPLRVSMADDRSFKIFLLVIVGFGLLNLILIQRLTQSVYIACGALKRPRSFD